jgi:hypothetical protein
MLRTSNKTIMSKYTLLIPALLLTSLASFGQLGTLGKKILQKAEGIPANAVNSLLNEPNPISTSFKDVDHTGEKGPDDIQTNFPPQANMFQLQRTPNGGFVLQQGFYYYQAQSYCLKAGTQGPSKGYGYMYAQTKGLAEEHVMTIVRNAVNHPEINQRDIQLLLWAIIARAKFENLQPGLKATASKLLTPRQLATLNRSALDLVPESVMSKARASVPKEVRLILDAENQLRKMLTSATSRYEDMEQVAVLAADAVTGNEEVKPGTWTYHPTGYYIRFFPEVYYQSRVEIYVPAGSMAVGKEFDPATHIAAPAETGRQRLLMSARYYSDNGSTPPHVPDPPVVMANAITTSLPDAAWAAPDKNGFTPGEAKRSMMALQRTPNGGFVLQPGYYELAAQSFTIKAGKQVMSPGGMGYVYAPTKGSREDQVMTILRNSVNQPQISQQDIQELLSAVISGMRFEELSPGVKATAAKLMTPRQLSALNTALTGSITNSGSAAIITQAAPEGIWSKHPDGYFVQYMPSADAKTMIVRIWVPQGSPSAGKEFDPATHVAVPADPTRDRIMFAGRPQQAQ